MFKLTDIVSYTWEKSNKRYIATVLGVTKGNSCVISYLTKPREISGISHKKYNSFLKHYKDEFTLISLATFNNIAKGHEIVLTSIWNTESLMLATLKETYLQKCYDYYD